MKTPDERNEVQTLEIRDGVAVSHEAGLDSLGTEFETVGVSRDEFIVTHSSFRRGGCLYAGTVYIRNWKTGAAKEIDITSRASDSEAHVAYLLGLAEKHVG